jgi:hypothetical protein
MAVVLLGWLLALVQPPDTRDAVITLQRTACFGACPVYTVTITGDGRVEYDGKEFVRVTGHAAATIAPGDVAMLVAAFEKADYFNLENRYTANITDMPTTITSIRVGGRSKSVTDYYGAPQVLKDLEKEIDRVARTAQWVKLDKEW